MAGVGAHNVEGRLSKATTRNIMNVGRFAIVQTGEDEYIKVEGEFTETDRKRVYSRIQKLRMWHTLVTTCRGDGVMGIRITQQEGKDGIVMWLQWMCELLEEFGLELLPSDIRGMWRDGQVVLGMEPQLREDELTNPNQASLAGIAGLM